MESGSIDSLVREVLEKMATSGASASSPVSTTSGGNGAAGHAASNGYGAGHAGGQGSGLTTANYPLATKHPEMVKTGTGKTLQDITLENVLNDSVHLEDMRITPEVLRLQAQIARSAGRERLAVNFERGAEMTAIPDERMLEMYNALRPYRSSHADLLAMADELESKYQARACAEYVREAATLYQQRKKLKGDE